MFWELTGKLSSMLFHVPEWKAKQHKHNVENKARINWLSQRRWGGGGLQSLYKISPIECIAEKQLSHELMWAGFQINWLGWDCALSLTSLACQAMLNLQPQTQCQIPYVSLLFLNPCLSACCSSCFFAWRWPWPATTHLPVAAQWRKLLSRKAPSFQGHGIKCNGNEPVGPKVYLPWVKCPFWQITSLALVIIHNIL